jgi:hypothetical protein
MALSLISLAIWSEDSQAFQRRGPPHRQGVRSCEGVSR